MKLRIKGDSLRLRLTRPEVQELVERGSVEAAARFADAARFGYAVRLDDAANALTAKFATGCVTVTVPAQQAQQWAASDAVGIYGEDGPLTLAVEKDFACIDRDDPEDADAFPNPKGSVC